MYFEDQNKFIQKAIEESAKKKESIILEQLGDLVKKGLLIIEESQPMIVKTREAGEEKFEMRFMIRLVLKDKDYISKLERENTFLRDKINAIESAFSRTLQEIKETK